MDETAVYLFNHGENAYAYRALGAHERNTGGIRYWEFSVFAPNAVRISVVGDFNNWKQGANPMEKFGETGCWSCRIAEAGKGDRYKFAITGRDGQTVLKSDPFAFRSELRPGTASVLHDIPRNVWTDGEYLKLRAQRNLFTEPINIYEVHAGSWKQGMNYSELGRELVDYCVRMGYTHIELLPLAEHPLDDSWGYQVTGYYAVTARYGAPEQLAELVDYAHKCGIGVIMDWVPAHFTKDESGLRRFDGGTLFEPAEPLRAEMPQWGTLLFDYGRSEVVSFLISNALYWLREFHFDGMRVDAVSCMLYHDFCRDEWLPNRFGGRENLEAIEFIKKLNAVVHRECPNTLMIAEESSAFPKLTEPVAFGGLGFDFKWNMGFMNDTLKYFSADAEEKRTMHEKLTFPMVYAFSEKHVLPFSHDEVVECLSKWWGIFLIAAGATGIFYTIYYFGENYAVAPVLNNLPACIYCWFSILAILAFMKKYGDAENKVSRWMLKKSWGIYVFHYLPLACAAYYLRSFTSELPEEIVYIVVGISAFAGALLLYEIIRRIPIICWCVLGLKKEKKDV